MDDPAGLYTPLYFNRGIEDFIGFVAAYLLTLVQTTPYRIQTLTALLLVFFDWMVIKRFLTAYVKTKDDWERRWSEVLSRLFQFVTTTLFFLLFYFSVYLLQQNFTQQKINIQEIVTILIVFMLLLFASFVLYKTRLRWNQKEYLRALKREKEREKQEQEELG